MIKTLLVNKLENIVDLADLRLVNFVNVKNTD